MTDREILERVINTAIINGFSHNSHTKFEIGNNVDSVTFYSGRWWTMHDTIDTHRLIFSHDLAKAFWGNMTCYEFHKLKSRAGRSSCFSGMKGVPPEFMWQHYLQQMVLEENPIQYLKKFL